MKRDFTSRNYQYLRFFISSKLEIGITHSYNKRKLDRLFMSNPNYEDWMAQYPDQKAFNKDRFLKEVQPIVACPIRIVDYDYPEYENRVYQPQDILIADELIRFFNSL